MAEIISYGVVKTPKGFETRKIEKSIEDLKHPKDALEKMYFQKKTPDGRILEPCCFHSHIGSPHPVGDIQKYKWCLEGIKDYAVCTADYQVYDLCNWMTRKQEEKQQQYYRLIEEKMGRYDHNMKITYSMHDSFMASFEKRKEILQKKIEFDKIRGKPQTIEDEPEYSLLTQILQKAEDIYEATKKNLEAIYNLKPQSLPKDTFIGSSSREEFMKVEKAKATLENWCNKFYTKPLSQEEMTLQRLEKQIGSHTRQLQESFETPCVYMHKAITWLDEMYHYYKKNPLKQDTAYMIENDLKRCEKKFKVYQEFIGDTPMETIIKKVEKEQRIASLEESKNKKVHFIQKLDSKQQGFVVKLDGSLANDTSEGPKLIIGSAVTSGKIEDDAWRKVRL